MNFFIFKIILKNPYSVNNKPHKAAVLTQTIRTDIWAERTKSMAVVTLNIVKLANLCSRKTYEEEFSFEDGMGRGFLPVFTL